MFVVIGQNNDAGHQAVFKSSIEEVQAYILDLCRDCDPPLDEDEWANTNADLARLDDRCVWTVRGSEGWREYFLVSPVREESGITPFSTYFNSFFEMADAFQKVVVSNNMPSELVRLAAIEFGNALNLAREVWPWPPDHQHAKGNATLTGVCTCGVSGPGMQHDHGCGLRVNFEDTNFVEKTFVVIDSQK